METIASQFAEIQDNSSMFAEENETSWDAVSKSAVPPSASPAPSSLLSGSKVETTLPSSGSSSEEGAAALAVTATRVDRTERLEQDVRLIEADAPLEQVQETICRFESLEQWLKQLKEQYKAGLIAWINANGEIPIGTVRYYVGAAKTTKPASNADTLKSLLELAGPEKTAECLASDAWKPGATRLLLEEIGSPEQFDVLFVTTVKEELKEGKPVKVKTLQKVDSQFLK